MSYLDIARAMVRDHEGLRLKPYRDTLGILTIGYGRNLEHVGISHEEALMMLENDLKVADRVAREYVGSEVFDSLPSSVKAALVDMAFNLGASRLKSFKRLREAILARDFARAAEEMLSSKWAQQVTRRAERLASMVKAAAYHSP